MSPVPAQPGRGRRAIVSAMRNEGLWLLEWLAYHKAIGFDPIFVATNDCTDDELAKWGIEPPVGEPRPVVAPTFATVR